MKLLSKFAPLNMLFIKDKQQRNVAKLCLFIWEPSGKNCLIVGWTNIQPREGKKIKYNTVIPFYQLMTFEITPGTDCPASQSKSYPANQNLNHMNAMSYTLACSRINPLLNLPDYNDNLYSFFIKAI